MPDPHVFRTPALTVTWSKARCIHAAECVRRLPAVFEPGRRPWVMPEQGDVEEVVRVIERCPTGALHYERHDGGAAEVPAADNVVYVSRSGPLVLRGDLELRRAEDGTVLRETRVALCRCGASRNRPFCDNSHWQVAFRDAGDIAGADLAPAPASDADRTLRVEPEPGGPLHLEGPFVLLAGDGQRNAAGRRAALCRCGRSATKPFCDGSHRSAPPAPA